MYRYILIGLLLGGVLLAQPKGTVQLFGGYSLPIGDLRGHFGDTTLTPLNSDSLTYLMTTGFNYGVSYKKPLFFKDGNFNLLTSLYVIAFGQSKDYHDFTAKLRQNILTVSLGAEWQFSPKWGKVNPFIDFEVMANFFNGSLTQEFASATYTMTEKSAFRLGFITGGGVDFALHQNMGVVVGVKYSLANVIGKDYFQNTDRNYGLNDKSYVFQGVHYDARSIEFILFYGGVSFYFGK